MVARDCSIKPHQHERDELQIFQPDTQHGSKRHVPEALKGKRENLYFQKNL